MINIVLIIFFLIWAIFASIEDFKKREVEDWLNYSLAIFALGFRFFYSLFNGDFSVFYFGLFGLAIFFILGNLFYYSKLFAGADAKMMISLGAILPMETTFIKNLEIFAIFLFLFLVVGGIYGIIWTIILSIKNKKEFKKDFSKRISKSKKNLTLTTLIGIVLIFLGKINPVFFILSFGFLFIPILYIYSKSVDEVAMVKKVKPNKLTVGDWLVKDVTIGKEKIKANWDGLTKEEIEKLRKNKKEVLVRYGIPFIPVFPISFILLILLKNFINLKLLVNAW